MPMAMRTWPSSGMAAFAPRVTGTLAAMQASVPPVTTQTFAMPAAMNCSAAFVARPHVAAGVSKAADDAAALVSALQAEGDVESALKRYEAARLKENYRIIERARHLGAYLQATQTQEEKARAGMHSTDAAVIAETAVLDFLYS